MLHQGKHGLAVFAACLLLANVACAAGWNLAADYSTSANPAGQWSYGYLNGQVFNLYDYQTTLSAQGSQCHGWRIAGDGSWVYTGNISKNLGPGIIDVWGAYLEVGTCKVQGSDDLTSLPGAQWTCPATGQYLYSAKFNGIWWSDGGHSTTVKVTRNATEELANGAITGFIGRSVSNYSDGFGDVRQLAYSGVLDLASGESIQFVGGGAGGYGNTVQLDVSVWPVADCCEISGHVTDEDTHGGIFEATVETSDGLFRVTTDSSGFYHFVVPKGTVTIKVTASNYGAGEATVEATTATISKDFALSSNATLAGMVLGKVSGQGIPGATVTAGSAVTITDYYGNYNLELPGGKYTLTAKAGGYVSAVDDVDIPRGSFTVHDFFLDAATISSVADDFADPLANPCGVWDYGFLDVYGSFTPFDTPGTLTPDTGNGLFKGWHLASGWTAIGALGKNVGNEPTDSWGWYTEVGQVVVLTSNSDLPQGARWTCPSGGQYKVYAEWTSQDTAVRQDFATVKLLRNGDTGSPIHEGTINGFTGREANGYLDRIADSWGTPTEAYFDATVEMNSSETLEFVASAPLTSQGHSCGLSAVIMPTSDLGTVSGTVILSGTSAPLPGARVSTLDGRIGTQTDSQGHYSLDAPAGSQVMAVRHFLCDSQTASVTITAGSTTTQDFQLVAVRAIVEGQVTSAATGEPIIGAVVQSTDGSVRARTGADGSYKLVLPVGTYSLIASKAHFGCQQVDNVVATGVDPIAVNFSLVHYGWDLAADYSLTANPAGQWSYGYLKDGVFNVYNYQTTLNAQGSDCHGWRVDTDASWCYTGNISKNLGPGYIDIWGAWLEIGTCKVQGCDDLVSLPGAQWTCPTAGQYLYWAQFNGIWWYEGGHSTNVKVTRGATQELASGVITGFIGRMINDYSDGFGDVRQLTYGGVLNLEAGDSLQFVGGGEGGYGNTVQLDIAVYAIADCCQVSGRVTDESGAGIAGATVATSDRAFSTTTDGAGYYNIVVPPGRVTLNATAPGYGAGATVFTATAGGILTGRNIVLAGGGTEVPTLVALRSVPDGTAVILTEPVIATAGKATFKSGSIYVEDSTRTMGIKILPGTSAPNVQIGDRVTFAGVINTDANGERCVTGSVAIASTPGAPVRPLGIAGKGLGSFVYGLSVTIWGKVTARTADYLYLDDGSGLLDGTGNTGIRVDLSDIAESGSAPGQSYMLVKGILGKSKVGSTVIPTIFPTSYSAIQGLTP